MVEKNCLRNLVELMCEYLARRKWHLLYFD